MATKEGDCLGSGGNMGGTRYKVRTHGNSNRLPWAMESARWIGRLGRWHHDQQVLKPQLLPTFIRRAWIVSLGGRFAQRHRRFGRIKPVADPLPGVSGLDLGRAGVV